MRIVISGGAGNLGMKLATALAEVDWCEATLLLDNRAPALLPGKATHIDCDLLDPADRRWIDVLGGADAVVHLAVANVSPRCTWNEAIANMTMTSNLLCRLTERTTRLVFASSIHTMAGYMMKRPAPGSLRPDTPPLPMSRIFSHRTFFGPRFRTNAAYGSCKLMGEAACRAAAEGSDGKLTSVSLRIGFVIEGDNRPDAIRLSAWRGGHYVRDWHRKSWLSNRDFCAAMLAALTADAGNWPGPSIVVNAVSANRDAAWNLDATEHLLGYRPVDDAFAELTS